MNTYDNIRIKQKGDDKHMEELEEYEVEALVEASLNNDGTWYPSHCIVFGEDADESWYTEDEDELEWAIDYTEKVEGKPIKMVITLD